MKLLFQSDDFGITEAVTLGIVKGIKNGMIRNTGLFTNMPASEFAASFIPELKEACFGVDVNFVAGQPLTDPALVPSLVDANGNFITSIAQFEKGKVIGREGLATVFENEPYVYEEILLEMEAQIKRYIELVGKKPEYLHSHSLGTPVTEKAFEVMAEKYDLIRPFTFWPKKNIYSFPTPWNIKPVFSLEAQSVTDVEENVYKQLDLLKEHEITALICHAGYVDQDLIDVSSYTLIRPKDLVMATSNKIMQYLKDNGIELITYRDLM